MQPDSDESAHGSPPRPHPRVRSLQLLSDGRGELHNHTGVLSTAWLRDDRHGVRAPHTHARSLRCSCAWAPHASPVPARFMPVAFRAAAASSLSQAPTDCSCRRKIFHPGHASGAARAGSDDACCSWSNASAYFHAPNLGTRAPRTVSPAVHVVLSFTSRSACSVSVSLSVSLSRALSLCLPFVIVPTGAWSGTDVASTHSDGKAWFSVPGPLEAKFPLPDNQTADHAVQTLRALAEKHVAGAKKPWFVAVGFHKVRVR